MALESQVNKISKTKFRNPIFYVKLALMYGGGLLI